MQLSMDYPNDTSMKYYRRAGDIGRRDFDYLFDASYGEYERQKYKLWQSSGYLQRIHEIYHFFHYSDIFLL